MHQSALIRCTRCGHERWLHNNTYKLETNNGSADKLVVDRTYEGGCTQVYKCHPTRCQCRCTKFQPSQLDVDLDALIGE